MRAFLPPRAFVCGKRRWGRRWQVGSFTSAKKRGWGGSKMPAKPSISPLFPPFPPPKGEFINSHPISSSSSSSKCGASKIFFFRKSETCVSPDIVESLFSSFHLKKLPSSRLQGGGGVRARSKVWEGKKKPTMANAKVNPHQHTHVSQIRKKTFQKKFEFEMYVRFRV